MGVRPLAESYSGVIITTVRLRYFVPVLCCWVRLLTPSAQAAQASGSTTLALVVAPQCEITIVSQSPGSPGTPQVLTFLYKVRTATVGGQGQITLKFTTADSNNLLQGAVVEYQTETSGPGTAMSGAIPTSNALVNGVAIMRFGAHASSIRGGATGTLRFTVTQPGSPSQALRPLLSISCQ